MYAVVERCGAGAKQAARQSEKESFHYSHLPLTWICIICHRLALISTRWPRIGPLQKASVKRVELRTEATDAH